MKSIAEIKMFVTSHKLSSNEAEKFKIVLMFMHNVESDSELRHLPLSPDGISFSEFQKWYHNGK